MRTRRRDLVRVLICVDEDSDELLNVALLDRVDADEAVALKSDDLLHILDPVNELKDGAES